MIKAEKGLKKPTTDELLEVFFRCVLADPSKFGQGAISASHDKENDSRGFYRSVSVFSQYSGKHFLDLTVGDVSRVRMTLEKKLKEKTVYDTWRNACLIALVIADAGVFPGYVSPFFPAFWKKKTISLFIDYLGMYDDYPTKMSHYLAIVRLTEAFSKDFTLLTLEDARRILDINSDGDVDLFCRSEAYDSFGRFIRRSGKIPGYKGPTPIYLLWSDKSIALYEEFMSTVSRGTQFEYARCMQRGALYFNKDFLKITRDDVLQLPLEQQNDKSVQRIGYLARYIIANNLADGYFDNPFTGKQNVVYKDVPLNLSAFCSDKTIEEFTGYLERYDGTKHYRTWVARAVSLNDVTDFLKKDFLEIDKKDALKYTRYRKGIENCSAKTGIEHIRFCKKFWDYAASPLQKEDDNPFLSCLNLIQQEDISRLRDLSGYCSSEFKALYEEFSCNHKASVRYNTVGYINQFVAFLKKDFLAIDREDVRRYDRYLTASGLADSGKRLRFQTFSGISNYLVSVGRWPSNPVAMEMGYGLPKKGRPRKLSRLGCDLLQEVPDDNLPFWEKFRFMRLKKGLTQTEVALALGFGSNGHHSISRIERGRVDETSLNRLKELCRFYGLPESIIEDYAKEEEGQNKRKRRRPPQKDFTFECSDTTKMLFDSFNHSHKSFLPIDNVMFLCKKDFIKIARKDAKKYLDSGVSDWKKKLVRSFSKYIFFEGGLDGYIDPFSSRRRIVAFDRCFYLSWKCSDEFVSLFTEYIKRFPGLHYSTYESYFTWVNAVCDYAGKDYILLDKKDVKRYLSSLSNLSGKNIRNRFGFYCALGGYIEASGRVPGYNNPFDGAYWKDHLGCVEQSPSVGTASAASKKKGVKR